MPRSRVLPRKSFSTRFSISDERDPRFVRMGMEMVETYGGSGWAAARHATMSKKGKNARAARALQPATMSETLAEPAGDVN